ncbi:unnamed protein product [Polarella glacialis]|uniref:Methyltransferase type 11 domain-containing protein n=1 Tax=Polarella glacialis TaxID=89957 RepID=A0A813FAA8_POLGL|nr:unnamed protein product [Polarella glacialis]
MASVSADGSPTTAIGGCAEATLGADAAGLSAEKDGVALPDFGNKDYWDLQYSKAADEGEEVYDWLLGWEQLRWLLEPLLAHDPRRAVLHLGNGNSPLPEEMYDAGYHVQTSVDISRVVVEQMAARNRGARPELRWLAADARELGTKDVPSDSFELVIDKSTMDALFCHEEHALAIGQFIKEAFRVTSLGGVFLSVSMHRPNSVLRWLRRRAFPWTVRVVPFEHEQDSRPTPVAGGRRRRPACHAYICSNKQGPADQILQGCGGSHWPALLQRLREHPESDVSEEEDSSEEQEEEDD